ncbi:MAG: DUF1015 domain-containing protein [Acidimicrobiaceae bacterium]|nr:DUF1015 family protein [Acidimicrobiaceae bacterium]MYA74502.1 DUF1015 domain-containing protein [Acidimicrobiaceae bacterium]MYG56364.1 DUF1015 domain-containing protein [Acidimicrobiaceae bacterium]MYJ97626.1 DUF1015 domain-containing protein [Acidimicrobiaceae bacterium]
MSAPLLAPFRGWLIRPEWSSRVIAGAYDSKTAAQRRAIVEQNPLSYLGVTRSHEDLIEGCSDADLLSLSSGTLERILKADAFTPSDHASFFAYRLSSPDKTAEHAFDQIGVVGALDIDGLRDGRVLTHENIRPERASLITDHLTHVGATSSPISLTHVAAPEMLEIVTAVSQRTPEVDVVVEGVRNQVWTFSTSETESIQPFLENPVVYVTDGHHRCAAALAGRYAHPNLVPFSRTLAVLFPHDQLRVEAFHRRAADRGVRSTPELVDALGTVGTVTAVSGIDGARPTAKGEIGVYHDRSWFRLVLDPLERPTTLASLDVERLRRDVIGHVLGVNELDDNSGVDYVPNPAGIAELVARCDADGHVGLLVYPTDINDLLAVAAAGDLMPPKSSYLDPKPPSGVFLRILGVGATEHLNPS